ncbi:MAG: DNA polymerase/3'-5' exonuclease PolX, partial [Candidatus Zixiibacteriota bacterium]
FEHIANILDIQGENPFKVRAYKRAVQILENLTVQLSTPEDLDNLGKLPGIGEAITKKIKELLETGKLKYYEELKKSEYAPLIEFLKIPGVGPKHAKLIYDELKIKTVTQLEKAAKKGKLKGIVGLGEKTEENILKGVTQVRKYKERFPLAFIFPRAQAMLDELKKNSHIKKITLAGSLRRMRDTIADVDILVATNKPKSVADTFTKLPQVASVLAKGETKSSIVTKDGFQSDLRTVKPEEFGAAQHYFTGSKAHNIRIRSLGVKKKLKVNEYGVFKGKKRIAGKTEDEVFKSVGLPFIPPELREDWGEIELGLKKKLPHLVELDDLKGDLHIHSEWTDGKNTIQEMAEAAKKRGYKYISICDHSPAVGITRGLNAERLSQQIKQINRLNKKFKNFKILSGIEVDIRADAKLDLPDNVLKELDVVIAAVHTSFNQPQAEMTKRLIKAVENPNVDIIAHPTGRLIGRREPYEVDMDKLMDACLRNNKVLELNAYPERLDLNDIHCRKAKEKGVKIAISTDAHSVKHLDWMMYGVATARRGWLEPEDVINTLGLQKLLKLFKR